MSTHKHIEFRTEGGKVLPMGEKKVENSMRELIERLILPAPEGLKIPIHSIFIKGITKWARHEVALCENSAIFPYGISFSSWLRNFAKVSINLICRHDLFLPRIWDFKVPRDSFCYTEVFWLNEEKGGNLLKTRDLVDEIRQLRLEIYEKLRNLEERILDESPGGIEFCSPILTYDSTQKVTDWIPLLESYLAAKELLVPEIKRLSKLITFLRLQGKQIYFHIDKVVESGNNTVEFYPWDEYHRIAISLCNSKKIRRPLLDCLKCIERGGERGYFR